MLRKGRRRVSFLKQPDKPLAAGELEATEEDCSHQAAKEDTTKPPPLMSREEWKSAHGFAGGWDPGALLPASEAGWSLSSCAWRLPFTSNCPWLPTASSRRA